MARLAFWRGRHNAKALEGARKARPILLKPRRGAGFGSSVPILKGERIGRESGALTGAIQALGSGFNSAGEDRRK